MVPATPAPFYAPLRNPVPKLLDLHAWCAGRYWAMMLTAAPACLGEPFHHRKGAAVQVPGEHEMTDYDSP